MMMRAEQGGNRNRAWGDQPLPLMSDVVERGEHVGQQVPVDDQPLPGGAIPAAPRVR